MKQCREVAAAPFARASLTPGVVDFHGEIASSAGDTLLALSPARVGSLRQRKFVARLTGSRPQPMLESLTALIGSARALC